MKPFLNLKSVDETLELIFGFEPLDGTTVALDDAVGRRLAEPFYAPADLPGFARSSMDGFAVRAADVFGAAEAAPALLKVAGVCRMGEIPNFAIAAGEAAAIPTGAPLPAGADAVVRIEDSREAGEDQVEIIRSAPPGANIVESDEDAAKGQELIPAGKLIRPAECGILAAFGASRVPVGRAPKVAVISTGDEIAPIDAEPAPGEIRDVNSHSLAAFCRERGAEPLLMGVVEDDREKLTAKLREALSLADLILVSGGSSAGARDHTVEAFLALPDSRLLVRGVAMRPGKPFILTRAAGKPLVGLPGHVAGALVCAYVFLGPLLARLGGQATPEPKPWITATLSRSVASGQGRRDYIRARLLEENGRLVATPLLGSSAVLSNLIAADGFVVCPENSEGLPKGREVKFYPL